LSPQATSYQGAGGVWRYRTVRDFVLETAVSGQPAGF
jgi:hypothetical protein